VDEAERKLRLGENQERIRSFRRGFSEFERILPRLSEVLPEMLTRLYSDCQSFAETEIKSILDKYESISQSWN